MSEDYGRITAAPPTIVLGGVSYLVSKQGPRIHGEIQQAVKAAFPDPRLMARELCRDVPESVGLRIWMDLCEQAKDWPPALESFEANAFLTTTKEGALAVIWALLRRQNAGLTFAKAEEIAEDITTAEVAELIRLSMPEPDFLPKAPTAPTEERGPVPLTS